ncbi:unnamed protein product [Arabidopsis lyrata]|nr:unnamed protein product [Arabidopsis lyrata]
MDRSTIYHSSSAPNSPASEPSSPMPPDSPKFEMERFHRWIGRSQPEVGFPLSSLTSPSVQPIYPWDRVPINGNGPELSPPEIGIGPVTDEDDEDSSDGSSFDSHPDSLFY